MRFYLRFFLTIETMATGGDYRDESERAVHDQLYDLLGELRPLVHNLQDNLQAIQQPTGGKSESFSQ